MVGKSTGICRRGNLWLLSFYISGVRWRAIRGELNTGVPLAKLSRKGYIDAHD